MLGHEMDLLDVKQGLPKPAIWGQVKCHGMPRSGGSGLVQQPYLSDAWKPLPTPSNASSAAFTMTDNSCHSLQVPWHAVLGNHDYGEVQDETPKKPRKQNCGSTNKSECYYSPLHQASRPE